MCSAEEPFKGPSGFWDHKPRPQLSIQTLSPGVPLFSIEQNGLTIHPSVSVRSLQICRGLCVMPLLTPAASLACLLSLLESQLLSSERSHAPSNCVTPTPFQC